MKTIFSKENMILLAFLAAGPLTVLAQDDNAAKDKNKEKDKPKDVQQIIITRTGADKDNTVVVEVKGDKVTVNGKPLDEYKAKDGQDIQVRVQKFKDMDGLAWAPRSRNGAGMGDFNNMMNNFKIFTEDSNKPMLGVTTEKNDDGVLVNDVTKESAAEKAGLKNGDIITKIDDQKIADPDALSAEVRKHKPGDKVTVYWLRDKKEMKAVATLTAWKGSNLLMNGQNLNFDQNFKFDMKDLDKIIPKMDIPQLRGNNFGQNWSWSGNGPKLGISVQDDEDGKGAKVIGVDEGSNADKAGIKEGDLITEADGQAIKGTDDMVKFIRDSKEKVSVMLKVIHDGKTANVEVKMPRRIKTADL